MAKRPTQIPRGTRAPGYSRAPNHRLAFVPRHMPVTVRALGGPIAETSDVIVLEEDGYPARHYLSRDGVDMTRLTPTDKVTFCPFKGLATYYVIRGDDGEIREAVWSYEQTYSEAELLRGRLAFDSDVVEVTAGL